LVQDQGDLKFHPAGTLWYFEELKGEINTEIGAKDIFETGSNKGDSEYGQNNC